MSRKFNGVINLDIRDFKPDWPSFLAERAPKDAPNVLVILYDDTGCAAWSPYGGRINMPTMDRLAKNGLTYSQWHTTSVCSPTRSCFLTGRNHHQNGFGTIAESAAGFPGYSGHIPLENATIATVLRDAGWSTFWIGKNHNVPVDAFDMGSSKKRWPLGLGYDRFYGFIGGETNQWYPELIEDNHYVDAALPAGGRLSLLEGHRRQGHRFHPRFETVATRQALVHVVLPGANHAPHHAPKDYIEKYKGKFDDGYEAYREWVLARMIERGILPKGTELTPINPMRAGTFIEGGQMRPWNTLSADEKKLFSRMAEVYAAFSEYTDVQIGRLIDYLEESGQLDNTLIFYCADNGASGEAAPTGRSTKNRFFNGYPDDIEAESRNDRPAGLPGYLQSLSNRLGGGVLHRIECSNGILNTREGGRSAGHPLAEGYQGASGECGTSITIASTSCPPSSNAAASRMPDVVDGVEQTPLAGVSMRYSFGNADAPTTKETQILRNAQHTRYLAQGLKPAPEHGPLTNVGKFETDRWQLFHTDQDARKRTIWPKSTRRS